MGFVHYRASTLGIQLEETLKEMLNKKFDRTMAIVLKKKVRDKPAMRGKLKHYQNCDGAWMFYVLDPEIRVSNYSLPVPINGPLKIIACESKLLSMNVKDKTIKRPKKNKITF